MIYDFHSCTSIIFHLNFNAVFKQCIHNPGHWSEVLEVVSSIPASVTMYNFLQAWRGERNITRLHSCFLCFLRNFHSGTLLLIEHCIFLFCRMGRKMSLVYWEFQNQHSLMWHSSGAESLSFCLCSPYLGTFMTFRHCFLLFQSKDIMPTLCHRIGAFNFQDLKGIQTDITSCLLKKVLCWMFDVPFVSICKDPIKSKFA